MNQQGPSRWQDRDELNLQEAFELGRVGMQSLVIINGGAAAGLLAFDGDIITHAGRPLLNQSCLLFAVKIFLIGGVGASIGAMIFAYILQLRYGSMRRYGDAAKDLRNSFRLHRIAACLALISLCSFVIGVVVAGSAFPKT